MNTADSLALGSLAIAVVALCLSWYAIGRANRTTSAATLVTLNEGFRQAWERFFQAQASQQNAELAELLNLFEIACAIYLERSLSGNSRELMNEYLNGLLREFVTHDLAARRIEELLQDEKTFIFVKRFLKEKKKFISVTVPPKWYEG